MDTSEIILDVDLSLSDTQAPISATPGSSIEVSWTATNTGFSDILAYWEDAVYLSKDKQLDSSDFNLTSDWYRLQVLTDLKIGESYSHKGNLNIPNEVKEGSYHLLFVADDSQNLTEIDEENNIFSVPFEINSYYLLEGTAGRDTITGTAANETIIGYGSADVLTGGEGKDRFVYTSLADRKDQITDFKAGVDKIVLTGLLDSLGYTGLDPIADHYIRLVGKGSHTIVKVDPDGVGTARAKNLLVVENISVAELSNPVNFEF